MVTSAVTCGKFYQLLPEKENSDCAVSATILGFVGSCLCQFCLLSKSILLLYVKAWLAIFEPVRCNLMFLMCSLFLVLKHLAVSLAIRTVDSGYDFSLFFSRRSSLGGSNLASL